MFGDMNDEPLVVDFHANALFDRLFVSLSDHLTDLASLHFDDLAILQKSGFFVRNSEV